MEVSVRSLGGVRPVFGRCPSGLWEVSVRSLGGVRLMGCLSHGMSVSWDVCLMGCLSHGMSVSWDVRLMGCPSLGGILLMGCSSLGGSTVYITPKYLTYNRYQIH